MTSEWHIGFAVFLVVVTVLAHRYFRERDPDRIDLATSAPEAPEGSSPEKIFRERLERYWATAKYLDRNIYLWTILVGFTFVILLRGEPGEDYKLRDLSVPAWAAHFVVVLSLFYLWIEFGALLKRLINERVLLWRMLNRIEGAPSEASPVWTRRNLLNVHGVLDVWFMSFLPNHSVHQPDAAARVTKLIQYLIWLVGAGMCGLAQASAIALLSDLLDLSDSEAVSSLAWALSFLALAIMIGCYWFFQAEGHAKHFFLACSVCAAAAICLMPQLRDLQKSTAKGMRETELSGTAEQVAPASD